MQNSDEGKAYMDLARRVDEAIGFMGACGLDMNSSVMRETEFYVSHEVCCAALCCAVLCCDDGASATVQCRGGRNAAPRSSAAAARTAASFHPTHTLPHCTLTHI